MAHLVGGQSLAGRGCSCRDRRRKHRHTLPSTADGMLKDDHLARLVKLVVNHHVRC